jgi:hypothetical protein
LYTCEAEKDDESDSAESINEEMENFQNDTSELIEDNTPRISLATITSITQPQTLKLKGHGVQWLQTLGTYSFNHHEHFIQFKCQWKSYKLDGFPPPQTQVVSSQQMKKMI